MNSSSSCYGNATEAEILAIKAYRAEKLARVTREYYGFMQLPLAAVSIVLTLFQGVVILKAIILRRVSRKSYVMILNRNIGDALCCTCVLIVSLCVILKEPDEDDIVADFLDRLCLANFWSLMVSYISLSLLKLYALWRPFSYRTHITFRKCLVMIAVSWILTLLLVSSELISRIIVQSVPAYRYLLICNQGRCPRNYLRFRPVLVVIAYFITIIVFIITAILLHRSHQFRNSFKPNERKAPVASRRYPTWKLGLNVATFAVFYLFYVVYIVIVMNKRECFLLEHMPKIRTIFAFIRLGLVVRIFVDQVVSMVTDQQLLSPRECDMTNVPK